MDEDPEDVEGLQDYYHGEGNYQRMIVPSHELKSDTEILQVAGPDDRCVHNRAKYIQQSGDAH
jgi:hypothetical protein